MPIFEYRCSNCETKFEKIVLRDSEIIECPNCHSRQTEKLFSRFAVAGGPLKVASGESGPCGVCGAPQRGMCGE